jgi:nucleoid-associated protein YgaU
MGLFDKEKETRSAVADNNEKRFEELKQKYASALRVVEQTGVRLRNLHVENNKLFLKGEAPSEQAKNQVWDQIKLVDPSFSDLMADITVDPNAPKPQAAQGPASGGQTYTVQAGDTLSKIAKNFYGDANAYMNIFNANKNILSDPNKISPGQQLVIPPKG